MKRERNTYSILFAFIVDGLVWGRFEERELVNKKEITADKPFWDGEVWAFSPPRKFSCKSWFRAISHLILNQ
jgi:hypothetical protein